MTWSEHYQELTFKDLKHKVLIPKSDAEIISLYIAIILNIIIYCFSWTILINEPSKEQLFSFFLFSFFSILFPIFIFRVLLLNPLSIKIFFYKTKNSFIEFNQKRYLKEYLNLNSRSKDKIFFVIWLGKKKNSDEIHKAIYFYSKYVYLNYIKKYDRYKYVSTYVLYIFFFTSLEFWALILLLTAIEIENSQNFFFLFSIIYILYIIYVAYLPYSTKEQNLFFKDYLKGFPENFFLLDSSLTQNNKEEKKTFDMLTIVFGVLFSLYITLAYNTIYTVNVDIKKISAKEILGEK